MTNKLDTLFFLMYHQNMKTSQVIASSVERLPKGRVFTYANFVSDPKQKEAVIKTLNRMVMAGKITKLSKGKYYKPEDSAFGKLPPSQNEIVKDLLEKDGKVIGYLTGYSIYNQLGLTTQVSNIIQIGRNETRPMFKRDRYMISFVRQKNAIIQENIPLLQILDAIRYLKKIPDANPTSVCKRLLAIIKDLPEKEKKSLVELALKYPPATRAFLGAALEETNNISLTGPLRKSLNPISTYKLSIAKTLKSAEVWNIR